jgi:acetylornithine deacetylase/succinyl-diaminopimelate desuccinylase family protein
MNKEAVFKELEHYHNDMIRFTQQLVKINSVNGNETEVCEAIAKKLNEYHIESKLVGDDPKRQSLLVRLDGNRPGKTLLLNGHTDTVPEGDPAKWKHSPFSAEFDDGKIYGRGAADMKGGLVALTYAVIVLKKLGLDFSGELVFLASASEEGLGPQNGVRYAISKGLKGDAAIVGEPHPEVTIGYRGVLDLELKTIGKTWHTGRRKQKGVNAVMKMAKVLLALERAGFRYKKHPMFPAPSITPGTKISGGTTINVVPDSCTALVNCRLSYGQTKESALADIKTAIRRLEKKDPQLKVEVKELDSYPPAFTSEDSEIVKTVVKNARQVMRKKPVIKVAGATSDLNFIVNKGIPGIVFGPDGDNLHAEDEWVDVASLLDAAKVYAGSVIDYLK